jgi:type II secretory ATPase GspE/PulE/Tfp pilus assembly ATPase PilB-like protein
MENLLNAFCDMARVNGYEVSQRGVANEITVNLKTQSGKKERRTLRFQGRPSLHGRVIVIRINHSVFRDFDQIGLEANQGIQIDNALANRSGLILVTGPTGSGKSNTLEAMLRKIEQIHEGRVNVIQIGNPIEFWNDDREQLTLKTDDDWLQAFDQCLRMDPDILSPGEFRNTAEAGVVFQAAATGHLTLTTLHTNNVAQTFSRLDFLGIERDKQAALLKLMVSQELVPLLCPHCKMPDPHGHAIAEQLIDVVFPNRRDLKDAIHGADSLPFFHKVGCYRCDNKGTKYRTCIAEVLTITPEISRMLRNKIDGEDIVNHAVRHSDMITLAEVAARKLCRGVISYDSVRHLLQYPHTVAPETQTYSWTQPPANAPYDAEAQIVEEPTDDFIEADFVEPAAEAARAA